MCVSTCQEDYVLWELVLLYILLPRSRFFGFREISQFWKELSCFIPGRKVEIGRDYYMFFSFSGSRGILVINFTTAEWVLNWSQRFIQLAQVIVVCSDVPRCWISGKLWTYRKKASRTVSFFLLLRYSPIIFLSHFGFSFKKTATSWGLRGVWRMPCSRRKAIPLDGFILNCSVPAWINFEMQREKIIIITIMYIWFAETPCVHVYLLAVQIMYFKTCLAILLPWSRFLGNLGDQIYNDTSPCNASNPTIIIRLTLI